MQKRSKTSRNRSDGDQQKKKQNRDSLKYIL